MQELGSLRGSGLAVSHDGFWFAVETLHTVTVLIDRLLAAQPAGITVRDICDELEMSRRRPTIALLEILDARGVTYRRGDVRVLARRRHLTSSQLSERVHEQVGGLS